MSDSDSDSSKSSVSSMSSATSRSSLSSASSKSESELKRGKGKEESSSESGSSSESEVEFKNPKKIAKEESSDEELIKKSSFRAPVPTYSEGSTQIAITKIQSAHVPEKEEEVKPPKEEEPDSGSDSDSSSSSSSSSKSVSSASTASSLKSGGESSSSSSSSDSDSSSSDSDSTRSSKSSRVSVSSKSSKSSFGRSKKPEVSVLSLSKDNIQTYKPQVRKEVRPDEVRLSVQITPGDPDDDAAKNKWAIFGHHADEFFFARKFLPVFGSLTIALLVVFSILIDIRLSGHKDLPYGVSFIFLMIGFFMWSFFLFAAALSRVRYAANIQIMPNNDRLFAKKWFNREGARMGALISFALALVLAFIFLILVSIKVDGKVSSFHSWRNPFICLWIMLALIGVGLLFSWRLVHGFLSIMTHILITAGMTVLAILVYLKIQGHITNSWYTCLIPLWILNFFLLVVLLWHVFVRTMCHTLAHPAQTFQKSDKGIGKEPKPVTMQDRASSIPLGVAGVFMFLFQVVIVAFSEGVFSYKYHVTWSFVWIWFWLACFFAFIFVLTFQYKPPPSRSKFTKADIL